MLEAGCGHFSNINTYLRLGFELQLARYRESIFFSDPRNMNRCQEHFQSRSVNATSASPRRVPERPWPPAAITT